MATALILLPLPPMLHLDPVLRRPEALMKRGRCRRRDHLGCQITNHRLRRRLIFNHSSHFHLIPTPTVAPHPPLAKVKAGLS